MRWFIAPRIQSGQLLRWFIAPRFIAPPVKEVKAAETSTAPGRQWLCTELSDRYWQNRKTILEVLKYLARLEHTLALAPRRRQRPPARRGGGE